jgi:hypothetical protein
MATTDSVLAELSKSIGYLAGAQVMGSLTATLAKFVKQADTMNKTSASIGTSVASVSKVLGPNLGNLAGRNEELQNALEMVEEGITLNNKELTKLTLENKVAGKSNAGLLKLTRQSIITGNLNNSNLSDFSERISKLRDTYQISTENIVDAMGKFSSDLDLAFYGVGRQFSEAAAKVAGKFGQGSEDLIERFSKQIMNPDMFGKRMAFGISDMAKKLMAKDSTAEQIEESLFGIAKTLQPMIDAQRQALEMQGLDPSVILQRLGDYFGSQELVTLSEAISKLQPKEIVPDIGAKQDPFANLMTALEKATGPLQELAANIVPLLVNNMTLLVNTLKFVAVTVILGTLRSKFEGLSRDMLKLGREMRAASIATGKISKIGNALAKGGLMFTRVLGFLSGPVGLLISLLVSFIPELMSWLGSGEDDEAEAEKKRAAEEERKRLDAQRQKAINDARAALNYKTNSLLEMQSQSLNRTMQDIIYGTDLSKRLLNVNEEQKDAMLLLLTVIQNNSKRGSAPIST